MKCPGLHCPGCGDGGGKAVVIGGGIVAAVLAAEWVASHAVEVLAVTAACGALAVAAVVALMRWGDRREARHAIERPFLTVREVPAAAVLSGTRVPIPWTSAERAALAPAVINLNFYGVPADERAAIIRTAIPGRPGDAITERK